MPGGITVRSWPIVTSGMRTNSVPSGILVEDEAMKIGVYCNHFRSQHKNKEVALDQLFRMRTELNESAITKDNKAEYIRMIARFVADITQMTDADKAEMFAKAEEAVKAEELLALPFAS